MSDSPKKQPHILIFTETFFPSQGGSERLAHNFAEELVRQGWKVSLFAPEMEGDAEFDQNTSYRVIRDRTWGRLRRIEREARPTVSRLTRLAAAIYLYKRFRHEKWDALVAVHLGPMALPARLLKASGRAPICVWAHGEELATAKRSRAMKMQVGYCLKTVDCIFTNSRETHRLARTYGVNRDRLVLQFPTPDRSFFRPLEDRASLKKKLEFEADEFIFVTISRLVERKGMDTALRALGELNRQSPDLKWRYLIGGVGDYKPHLRELAEELGIRERVRFLGALEEEEKHETIEAADLFLMPNRQIANGEVEGFGIVFLEAALRGTPSIGGRSGGTVDAVEEGVSGWLVDPNTPDETLARIQAALESPPSLASMRSSAREWAETKFDSHRRHEAIVSRLRKLIDRRARRRK